MAALHPSPRPSRAGVATPPAHAGLPPAPHRRPALTAAGVSVLALVTACGSRRVPPGVEVGQPHSPRELRTVVPRQQEHAGAGPHRGRRVGGGQLRRHVLHHGGHAPTGVARRPISRHHP